RYGDWSSRASSQIQSYWVTNSSTVDANAPNNGTTYPYLRDACVASTLLFKGGPTLLDAMGIIPIAGNAEKGLRLSIQVAQHAATVGSLALVFSKQSKPADAALTSTGAGLTVVDDAKVMATGAELIPVLGNGVSIFATARDIREMSNYYKECMEGKN
ncbi:MAG TPA: hypothetical protein VHU44_09670, partial [Acidobacteriaceae bacterium]|nr:hypothetical protein [Acidobacteriaceae bacterium]